MLVCAVWVNSDAKKQGVRNVGLWTLVAFLFSILGLMLYLLVGRKHPEEKRICPQCGLVLPASHNFCPSCGKQFPVAQEQRSKACTFCGRKLTQDAKFCDACGKTQGSSELNAKGIAVFSVVGGVLIALLTVLVWSTPQLVGTAYGYPLAWLSELVLPPEYSPWRMDLTALFVDIVAWTLVVAVMLYIVRRMTA
jgi:RNA polymerase subunit RPABC4/transcription elongation factor Spt4